MLIVGIILPTVGIGKKTYTHSFNELPENMKKLDGKLFEAEFFSKKGSDMSSSPLKVLNRETINNNSSRSINLFIMNLSALLAVIV